MSKRRRRKDGGDWLFWIIALCIFGEPIFGLALGLLGLLIPLAAIGGAVAIAKIIKDGVTNSNKETTVVKNTPDLSAQGTAAQNAASGISEENQKILRTAKQQILQCRINLGKIKSQTVHLSGLDAVDNAEKIVNTLQVQQEEIRTSHQFLNYYLPTLASILKKYVTVEGGNAASAEMEQKTDEYLKEIAKAMNKEYHNLFEDELLDLSVDMEAMQMAFKRDGLLDDMVVETEGGAAAAVQSKEEEQVIKLTL